MSFKCTGEAGGVLFQAIVYTSTSTPQSAVGDLRNFAAEREGFEPPGLLSRPLSRRMRLSTLPPFRPETLADDL